MREVMMLVTANIKKNKAHMITMMIIMIIAAALLNTGLVVYFGVGNLFNERAEINHSAHHTAVYADDVKSIDEGLAFMETYSTIAETERLEGIGGMGDYYMDSLSNTCFMMILKVNDEQTMDRPSFIGDTLPLGDDGIYIPYFIMLGGNYEIGDEFKLLLSGTTFSFTIAGAVEEMMFGAQFNTLHRFYVSDAKFETIQSELPETKITLLSARLTNSEEDIYYQAEYNKEVSTDGLYLDLSISIAKQARTMIPTIAAIVVTAFAIILLVISMIVIRFRIINSIEESMVNIGALKAIGYKSSQIILSIMLQFVSITFIGAIIGVIVAQIAIPIVMGGLEPMTALVWTASFNFAAALTSIIVVLSAVALISFLSAGKVKNLHPLEALSGGGKSGKIKKNTFRLDNHNAPLGLLLALKQVTQKKKQTIAICIIVAALTMASVAGIAVSYNMSGGRDHFARALFGEMPDISFMLRAGENGDVFKDKMLADTSVRKSFGYETSVTLLVDDTSILTTIVEDCELLEGSMLIEGRYPFDDSEIALGPSILKVLDKEPGDTVVVKSGDTEEEFTISGMVQFMQSNGFNGMVIGSGLRRVQPSFEFLSYNVYVEDGTNVKEFIDSVRESEGEVFDIIMDMDEQLQSTMSTMGGIFSAVAFGVTAVTAIVIVFVLYVVIKTTILRRKRELGISKAVGYTTWQLMNQISLSLIPAIMLGVLVGAFAGYFGLNPMMGALMGGMGIVKVALPVPMDQTIMVCVALIILAYAASMLISRRIRKISAYSLVVGNV